MLLLLLIVVVVMLFVLLTLSSEGAFWPPSFNQLASFICCETSSLVLSFLSSVACILGFYRLIYGTCTVLSLSDKLDATLVFSMSDDESGTSPGNLFFIMVSKKCRKNNPRVGCCTPLHISSKSCKIYSVRSSSSPLLLTSILGVL